MPTAERPPWGYHQLGEPWARRLVASAGVVRGDLVLDIGAGDGAITAHLLERGARVIAVELHPGRARRLRRRFGADVTVVQADATDLRLPRRDFRVVANPPFGISTALLRRLTHPASRMVTADIVLPSYASARWAAGRGPGRGDSYSAGVVVRLPSRAFHPPAPMATSVLHIERRSRSAGDPHAPPGASWPASRASVPQSPVIRRRPSRSTSTSAMNVRLPLPSTSPPGPR